jgi:hypothetical protein
MRRRLREQRQQEPQEAVAPSFSRTAARMTDPGVGASTCASGSHVWNGKIGTLMANASANAPNSQYCSVNVSGS